MNQLVAEIISRQPVRVVHRLLVAGLSVFWLAVGALIYFRVSPLSPADPFPPVLSAAVCAAPLLAAWFWARRRIPSRLSTVTLEDYWRGTVARAAMDRFLFLLEGSATLSAAWTMLTASWMTTVVGLVSLAVMALNGPERFERSADGLEP
jgi:hypothetical protein